MAEPLSLAPMTIEDLDEVLVIERASFHTPWSMVSRLGQELAGYLCLWEIGHEIHVTNLAVHPRFRRRGVARALLGAMLDEARRKAVELVFLEVRPTNVEALTLYESLGFRVIGRRKGYYFDTGEDALVMEAKLAIETSKPAAVSQGAAG
jgi:ribosomal-protein-alanine N-acetyltransferase